MKLPECEPDAAKAMLALGEALDIIVKRFPDQAHTVAGWLLGTAIDYFEVNGVELEEILFRVRSLWPNIQKYRAANEELLAQVRAAAAKGDN